MPTLVYTLCFITSSICAGLLLRSFFATQARLLLWSALAFVALAVNNFFVLMDVIIMPEVNFLPYRHLAALTAVCVLIYGFIWEVE